MTILNYSGTQSGTFWSPTRHKNKKSDHVNSVAALKGSFKYKNHSVSFCLSQNKMAGYRLDVVVKLAWLSDLQSYAGWELGPWQVQSCRIGQEVELGANTPFA